MNHEGVEVEVVEELPSGYDTTQEILQELERATEQLDSSQAINVDANGAGYSPPSEFPFTFSDDGAKGTYSSAPVLFLPAPVKVLSLPAPNRPLFLPATTTTRPYLESALVKLLIRGSGYSDWLEKFFLKVNPQRACLLLESKFKSGTCWSFKVKDPLLAILTGSLEGKPAPWEHPCVLDVVDWRAGEIHVWVMTGAAPNGEPRPKVRPFR